MRELTASEIAAVSGGDPPVPVSYTGVQVNATIDGAPIVGQLVTAANGHTYLVGGVTLPTAPGASVFAGQTSDPSASFTGGSVQLNVLGLHWNSSGATGFERSIGMHSNATVTQLTIDGSATYGVDITPLPSVSPYPGYNNLNDFMNSINPLRTILSGHNGGSCDVSQTHDGIAVVNGHAVVTATDNHGNIAIDGDSLATATGNPSTQGQVIIVHPDGTIEVVQAQGDHNTVTVVAPRPTGLSGNYNQFFLYGVAPTAAAFLADFMKSEFDRWVERFDPENQAREAQRTSAQ